MKKALQYIALLAVVGFIVVTLANDPFVKSKVAALQPSNDPQSQVTTFATALCNKDVPTIMSFLGGHFAKWTVDDVKAANESIPDCKSVRYLGAIRTQDGPEYFFALDVGDEDLWFGITFVDGKVINIE